MSCMALVVWPYSRLSHPYNSGTEDVGFSPTGRKLLALSAKRREGFGKSHEG